MKKSERRMLRFIVDHLQDRVEGLEAELALTDAIAEALPKLMDSELDVLKARQHDCAEALHALQNSVLVTHKCNAELANTLAAEEHDNNMAFDILLQRTQTQETCLRSLEILVDNLTHRVAELEQRAVLAEEGPRPAPFDTYRVICAGPATITWTFSEPLAAVQAADA